MDCLLCIKLFIKEMEYEDYNQNPQVCKRAILDLFGISSDTDVHGLSEDLVVCVGCHQKLEAIGELLDQFKELLRKVEEAKIEIKNDMIKSKMISEVMAESTAANRMSPSSQDRCTLLKAIEAKTSPQAAPMDQSEEEGNGPIGENVMDGGIQVQIQQIGVGMEIAIGNTRPSAPDHDGINTGDSGESSDEEQDPATDNSENEDSDDSSRDLHGVLPAGATMLKEVKICLEHVQIPPGDSTIKTQVKSHPVPYNSKGGYTLRNPKPSAKTTKKVKESSDEESSSESDAGDGLSSEDDPEGGDEVSNSSRGSAEVKQKVGKGPIGPAIKEFTPLENGSYQCKHCFNVINKKSNLGRHLLIHGPRRFKCSVGGCGKRFTRKSTRDNHVKGVHERRRDFKCTWTGCGKRLSSKHRMIFHVKGVHQGRRDFKCGVEGCDKAFSTNQNLKFHMSTKHNIGVAKKKSVKVARVMGPRPDVSPKVKVEVFDCRMTPCRRVFKSEISRNTHEESHTQN